MKWTELLRKDNYALLQSESDTQYAVVSGYDPTQPEDQQWSHGMEKSLHITHQYMRTIHYSVVSHIEKLWML